MEQRERGGSGGNIRIKAEQLDVGKYGEILVETLGSGDGGTLRVEADRIKVSGKGARLSGQSGYKYKSQGVEESREGDRQRRKHRDRCQNHGGIPAWRDKQFRPQDMERVEFGSKSDRSVGGYRVAAEDQRQHIRSKRRFDNNGAGRVKDYGCQCFDREQYKGSRIGREYKN